MDSPSAPGGAEMERLQKVLASRGFGSRRHCEVLISEGRVTINGEVAILGRRVDVDQDLVEVDGAPVGIRPDFVYYLLNKPKGVVSTASDTHDRETVVALVPAEPRVYPVGRLDADSEGLILLTNDGQFANRVMHPRYGCEKEYLVVVGCGSAGVKPAALRTLREGVLLEDGMTAPAKVAQTEPGILRITIGEGRNRQIRRMCLAVGHPVERLIRVRIGVITDKRLKPGEFRRLSMEEVFRLTGADKRAQGYS